MCTILTFLPPELQSDRMPEKIITYVLFYDKAGPSNPELILYSRGVFDWLDNMSVCDTIINVSANIRACGLNFEKNKEKLSTERMQSW